MNRNVTITQCNIIRSIGRTGDFLILHVFSQHLKGNKRRTSMRKKVQDGE